MPRPSAIPSCVEKNITAPHRAKRLSKEQRQALKSEPIRRLITQGFISIQQLLQLSFNQRKALESKPIRRLITKGIVTIDQLLQFGYDQRQALENKPIRALISTGTITTEQLLQLRLHQRLALENEPIRKLIIEGTLAVEQLLQLDAHQRLALESNSIRELMVRGILTIEQLLQLSFDQREALESEPIRELIVEGIITLDQTRQFNARQRRALADDETRQRLRNGGLTIQQIMDEHLQNESPNTAAAVYINNDQSTHTTSVHRTVSASALRLLNRYSQIRDFPSVDRVMNAILETINALPDGNPKYEAAKRCAKRLASQEYAYTDSASGISTRQLLTLTWFALHDDEKRTADLAEAKECFIEGLYEIQRGYNLSATGLDLSGEDLFICSGGAFNKLLEKLNGVHPDVRIEYITPQLAALKLPLVVKEEVVHYLAARATPSTADALTAFTRQVNHLKTQGIESIWEVIKSQVSARLFDEFSSLYDDRKDPRFTRFIEAGIHADLTTLPSFQKEVCESRGYQKYCSAVIRTSLGLFSPAQPQIRAKDVSKRDEKTAQL